MVIYFNVPEVREYLINKGNVYTVRRKRRTGETMARSGSYYDFKELGLVKIEHEKTIRYIGELEKYAAYSGFSSRDEWIKAIQKLKLGGDWQLYYVELIDE